MKLVLIGPPGSGKGTQALKLKEQYGIPHLSSGDVLRAQVAAGTEFGKKIKVFMDRGEIGPAELITEVILHHLAGECPGGFILDGFPRTVYQADKLSEQHRIDAALFIDVSEREITSRITGRRICRGCGKIYHIVANPPEAADRCDACSGPLYHRPDDNEETILNRIRVYNNETRPVLDFYRNAGLLHAINGEQDSAVIFKEIVRLVE
jgi:adenylate kinase